MEEEEKKQGVEMVEEEEEEAVPTLDVSVKLCGSECVCVHALVSNSGCWEGVKKKVAIIIIIIMNLRCLSFSGEEN